MHIQTFETSVNLITHDGTTRLVVSESEGMQDYILAIHATPYEMYIVEWAKEGAFGKPYLFRELLLPPRENPTHWLDDLVRSHTENGWYIVGIMPLSQVQLARYAIPVEYRQEQERIEHLLRGENNEND